LALNTAHVHLSDSEDLHSPDSPLTTKHASIGVGNAFKTAELYSRSQRPPTALRHDPRDIESFTLPPIAAPVNGSFMGGILRAVSNWTASTPVSVVEEALETPASPPWIREDIAEISNTALAESDLPNYLTTSQISIRIASPPSEVAEPDTIPPSPDTSEPDFNATPCSLPPHSTPIATSPRLPETSSNRSSSFPIAPSHPPGSAPPTFSDSSTVTPCAESDLSMSDGSNDSSRLAEVECQSAHSSMSDEGDDGAETYSADRSESEVEEEPREIVFEHEQNVSYFDREHRETEPLRDINHDEYFSPPTETTPLLSAPNSPFPRPSKRRNRGPLVVTTPHSRKAPPPESEITLATPATPYPTFPASPSQTLANGSIPHATRSGHRKAAHRSKSGFSVVEKPFHWHFIAGLLLYVSSQSILTAITLPYLGPLLMAPLSSLSLIFNALFAWLINGGRVGWRDVVGTVSVVLGSVLRTYPWLRFVRRLAGFRKDAFAEDGWRLWLNEVAGEVGLGDWFGKVEGLERGIGVGFAVAGGFAASETLVVGRHTMDLLSTFLHSPTVLHPPPHPVLTICVLLFLLLTVLIQLSALGRALPLATPLVAVPVFFAAYVLPEVQMDDVTARPPTAPGPVAATAPVSIPLLNSSSLAAPRPHKQSGKTKAKTKVVVRRLPPNLPESIFWGAVETWMPHVDWKVYVLGKVSTNRSKEPTLSRAYLNFNSLDALVDFARNFDGHSFIDSKGNHFRAIVEFSPFQRVPPSATSAKKPRRVDPRQNTVDRDADYLAFLEQLERQTQGGSSGGTFVSTSDSAAGAATAGLAGVVGTVDASTVAAPPHSVHPPGGVTPLILAIRAKREAAQAKKIALKEKPSSSVTGVGKKEKESEKGSGRDRARERAKEKSTPPGSPKPKSTPPGSPRSAKSNGFGRGKQGGAGGGQGTLLESGPTNPPKLLEKRTETPPVVASAALNSVTAPPLTSSNLSNGESRRGRGGRSAAIGGPTAFAAGQSAGLNASIQSAADENSRAPPLFATMERVTTTPAVSLSDPPSSSQKHRENEASSRSPRASASPQSDPSSSELTSSPLHSAQQAAPIASRPSRTAMRGGIATGGRGRILAQAMAQAGRGGGRGFGGQGSPASSGKVVEGAVTTPPPPQQSRQISARSASRTESTPSTSHADNFSPPFYPSLVAPVSARDGAEVGNPSVRGQGGGRARAYYGRGRGMW
ncbi:hypothetical protein HDU93_003019, partial [Gonapodya sp. JEL0774]